MNNANDTNGAEADAEPALPPARWKFRLVIRVIRAYVFFTV
jgi:hypothetical protein